MLLQRSKVTSRERWKKEWKSWSTMFSTRALFSHSSTSEQDHKHRIYIHHRSIKIEIKNKLKKKIRSVFQRNNYSDPLAINFKHLLKEIDVPPNIENMSLEKPNPNIKSTAQENRLDRNTIRNKRKGKTYLQ